jgi:hypothetical protein
MPKGRDSKNDPRRRPKIIDLDHFRQTKEIKDVAEVNEMRKKENLDRKNAVERHPSDTSRPVYDHVEEEKKAAELESKVSEDTDPTPYQGIPRPKEAAEYPEEADFIDRNPANKTMIEKMYEKFEKSYDDWKNKKKKEDE